jgi:hypothetical protein
MQLAAFSKFHAQRIIVLLYDEASHSSKIDAASYDREWATIHTRMLAKIDSQLAEIENAA